MITNTMHWHSPDYTSMTSQQGIGFLSYWPVPVAIRVPHALAEAAPPLRLSRTPLLSLLAGMFLPAAQEV
jgi:hypothetical protein